MCVASIGVPSQYGAYTSLVCIGGLTLVSLSASILSVSPKKHSKAQCDAITGNCGNPGALITVITAVITGL